MIASNLPGEPVAGLGLLDPIEALLPLELLELELSLDGYGGGEAGFCAAVRAAVQQAGGEMLFDLPGSALLDNCSRLAVLRIPDALRGTRIILAVLDQDGVEIRVQQPDEELAPLVRFTNAFVNVLERV